LVLHLLTGPSAPRLDTLSLHDALPISLRQLFLEEFVQDLSAPREPWDSGEGKRAAALYDRVFVGYGDDSVAQLGGAHLACEWVSDRKSTRLNSSHRTSSYAVLCLKKKS